MMMIKIKPLFMIVEMMEEAQEYDASAAGHRKTGICGGRKVKKGK